MIVLGSEITRDAEHRYRDATGRRLLGVTECLQAFGFLSDFSAPYLAEKARAKAELGTLVHKAIELHLAGQLDVFSLDPAIEPYFTSWLRFEAETALRVIYSESLVYDEIRAYAGQVDLVAELNGAPWVLDFKTGQKAPGHKYQLAAYAQALPKELQPVKRGGIYLFGDGRRAELVPFTDASDARIFNGLVSAFYAKVNDGLIKWNLKEAA